MYNYNINIFYSEDENMLLSKAIYQNEGPFEIFAEKKGRHGAFGYLKGKINVPDDFNEPLDDFKEYM